MSYVNHFLLLCERYLLNKFNLKQIYLITFLMKYLKNVTSEIFSQIINCSCISFPVRIYGNFSGFYFSFELKYQILNLHKALMHVEFLMYM